MSREKHLKFIKNHPFTFDVSKNGFSEKEVLLIERCGHWFEAIRKGELEPISDEQRKFIIEMNSQIPWDHCKTYARFWKRYKRKEIEEKDNGVMNAPPPTLEDDPFYSREGAKELRKSQFSTISKQHRL